MKTERENRFRNLYKKQLCKFKIGLRAAYRSLAYMTAVIWVHVDLKDKVK